LKHHFVIVGILFRNICDPSLKLFKICLNFTDVVSRRGFFFKITLISYRMDTFRGDQPTNLKDMVSSKTVSSEKNVR